MLSAARVKVLAAFLKDPSREQYGFGLMKVTGVKSGSLYPLLDRLEHIGWLDGYDEDIDEQVEGRPRRRLYRLTTIGRQEAESAVADFYRDLGRRPRWVPARRGIAP